MGSRVKVSDLRDIEKRESRCLSHVPFGETQRSVLHIVDRSGFEPTGNDRGYRCGITACNRVAKWWTNYNKPSLPDEDHYWKLCPRCGGEKDFQDALDEQIAWVRKAREEREARALSEKADRIALISDMGVCLRYFEGRHITPDAEVIDRGDTYIVFKSNEERFKVVVKIEGVME